MSSKGEVLGGILGVGIASIPGVGMTAFMGLQLGSALGGMLLPNDAPSLEQGRLSDVRGSGSSQGVPIPRIYGRQRVGVVVVYLGEVREVAVNQGGGGGGKK